MKKEIEMIVDSVSSGLSVDYVSTHLELIANLSTHEVPKAGQKVKIVWEDEDETK